MKISLRLNDNFLPQKMISGSVVSSSAKMHEAIALTEYQAVSSRSNQCRFY